MAAVLEAAGVPYDATLVDELVELERAHLDRRHPPLRRRPPGPRVAPRARREDRARQQLLALDPARRPERLGLEAAFDRVVLSFEVRAMKPDPAIYRATLEQLGGVSPERAVFVDDQPTVLRRRDGDRTRHSRLILRPNEDVPADLGTATRS